MKLPLKTDLSGKVAVVTGAGGVLCGEFSKALAAAGAKVALLNRTLAHAEAVAEEIRAQGGTAKAYQCNVLDREALDACHQAVLADFGPVIYLSTAQAATTREPPPIRSTLSPAIWMRRPNPSLRWTGRG